ncbi:MAG: Asp-tRNA(Asn)/Glu-tRNA(Gln) amidotransferase subunit GatB [Anaerolineales bacterium]|nr:Asp-tRNA(Asn)/Glu-tRNA(Gln) amidotransferase subunit GatB [Anaerolineales bacterium]
MLYEPVIGLEVHAELETKSKMFCPCPVVDATRAEPNVAVCPVCAGMPGVLPVLNRKAVEYGLRVALALKCEVMPVSIFARKNYFYPDLPKGYQISQYEQPLARQGHLDILTSQGERTIRIRRVHLEEDTGKLTHISSPGQAQTSMEQEGDKSAYSLVDLNRAGVPLVEIVTEPDFHSAEEVRAYAVALRSLLRYLGVNSGDMQKGVLRIEPNISVRPVGSPELGTRVEIKNLNSFRVLERAVTFEIQRQTEALQRGERIFQETRGWDDEQEITILQRRKETEDDYRYFPEPDLPPLVIDSQWLHQVQSGLPELPAERLQRFQGQYGLSAYDAGVLTAEMAVADYYERAVQSALTASPKMIANWVTGELFGWLNQVALSIDHSPVSPQSLAELADLLAQGEINQNTAKAILTEMLASGKPAGWIADQRGLRLVSDARVIAGWVSQVLHEHPEQVNSYLAGKETISGWFFGQVMRLAKNQADPEVLREELERQLHKLKGEKICEICHR